MPLSTTDRQRLSAALRDPGMSRRVKLIDRTADGLIRSSGIGVIGVVALIFVFLALEAWPLFRGASQRTLHAGPLPVPAEAGPFLALGLDEYEAEGYVVDAGAGAVRFFDLAKWEERHVFPLPSLAGTRATCVYRLPVRNALLIGTADGRIVVAEADFEVTYDADGRTIVPSARELGVVTAFANGSAVRLVHGRQDDYGDFVIAAVSEDDSLVAGSMAEGEPTGFEPVGGGIVGRITSLAVDFERDKLFAATDRARLYQWYLQDDASAPFRTYDLAAQEASVADACITAMDFTIGDASVLLGFGDGRVEQWAGVREQPTDVLRPFHPINTFKPLPAAVTAIQPSGRDKGFLVGGADGSVHVKFTTSRRTVLETSAGAPVRRLAYAPKLTSFLVLGGEREGLFTAIHNPHPEVSLRVLFGKVHYEGYDEPQYIWQSTGGTDNFESKLSLVPLVVGTIKGALYGLFFAVPIAVVAALYTSQFMSPRMRSVVKPTVEIMAALPSVVIGFLAGLWLAPLLEARLVGALLIPVVVVPIVFAAALAWHQIPHRVRAAVPGIVELALLVVLVLAAGWLSQAIAPAAERLFFDGNFRQWVFTVFGEQVEQRNSIVIGVALGFAVIPIIFTISEDAFSNVPPSFKSASLALGASPWQTAFRIVLPTASPGVFSAVMIGFGRAVGETMIVLMATGNTPILSFSPFNGMRTLSANIAVEIPEAPVGGTLYRVLFVTALLLFALTFLVNTVAEVVRQRLRQRYQAV